MSVSKVFKFACYFSTLQTSNLAISHLHFHLFIDSYVYTNHMLVQDDDQGEDLRYVLSTYSIAYVDNMAFMMPPFK